MQFALMLGQLLLRFGPELADRFIAVAYMKDPTEDDYRNLVSMAKQSQQDYIDAEVQRRLDAKKGT